MRYRPAKEIKSQTKVIWKIYVFDFIFFVIYIYISFILSSMVHSKLKILYYVFSSLMAIFLTLPSRYNKKRRNYQSIFLLLKHDTNVYRPIKKIREK